MTLTRGAAVFAAVLVAGTAAGQFSAGFGLTSFQSFDGIGVDGSPLTFYSNYNGAYNIDKDDIFLPERTLISNSFVADTSALPSIDSMQTMTTVAGQSSDTRFELSWDLSADVDLGDTFDPAGRLQTAPLRGAGGGRLLLTEDAQVRITVDFGAIGMVGEGLANGSVNNFAEITFGGDVPSPFTTGYGRAVNVPSGFSIDFDIDAGEEILFGWDMNFSVDILDGQTNGLTGWNQAAFGSMVIEVIPAPASFSLLAIGGFCATRRRR